MPPIYTALNEAAAKTALENLRRDFGKKSPGLVAAWDRAWDQFIPFLEFDSAIRKVIYTTNAIESVNFQLRNIIKNRVISPATTPRSSCFTSGSGISPAVISTATGWSANKNAERVLTAGKQP